MLSDDRIISYNMTDNLLTKGIITMNFLEERIMKDGVVKEGNILKVDSFLNHQMDVKLFKQMGEEFKRRFAGKNINKIITIEASGIGIACIVAECFDVPVVFAKKSQSVNIDGDVYSAEVESFTHKCKNQVLISKKFVGPRIMYLLLMIFLQMAVHFRDLYLLSIRQAELLKVLESQLRRASSREDRLSVTLDTSWNLWLLLME